MEVQPALRSPSLLGSGTEAGWDGREVGPPFLKIVHPEGFFLCRLYRATVCSSCGPRCGLIMVFSPCTPQHGALAINENLCRALHINEVKMRQPAKVQRGRAWCPPFSNSLSCLTLTTALPAPTLLSTSPQGSLQDSLKPLKEVTCVGVQLHDVGIAGWNAFWSNVE